VIPVYDTTALHSQAAVEWILSDENAEQEQELAQAQAGG
jgi:hypothetical protein